MSINLKGHTLNQRQLDAIVPVMNELMQGKVSQKNFERACIEALEAAGCPIGYDTTMPGADKSVQARALAWREDGDVGLSSKAIYCHMMGQDDPDDYNHPLDPADLNRCLLLLDLIPEWKPRIGEMARYGQWWKDLVKHWDEISARFIDEAGLGWSKAKRAPKTYALMKKVMEQRG